MIEEFDIAEYLALAAVHDDLSTRIWGAISRREWRLAGELLCDRACAVMQMRDRWWQLSPEWERWDTFMQRDVNAAEALARRADTRAAA